MQARIQLNVPTMYVSEPNEKKQGENRERNRNGMDMDPTVDDFSDFIEMAPADLLGDSYGVYPAGSQPHIEYSVNFKAEKICNYSTLPTW